LAEVEEAASFGVSGVQFAVQSVQLSANSSLSGEGAHCERLFTGGEDSRGSNGFDLVEEEASKVSERMLRSVQHRSAPPALIGSWRGHAAYEDPSLDGRLTSHIDSDQVTSRGSRPSDMCISLGHLPVISAYPPSPRNLPWVNKQDGRLRGRPTDDLRCSLTSY
jgi:hypothetical protein